MRVTQPGLEAHAVIVDVAPGGGGGVVRAALRVRGGRVGPTSAVLAAAVRRGRGDGVRVDVHQEPVLIPESEKATR